MQRCRDGHSVKASRRKAQAFSPHLDKVNPGLGQPAAGGHQAGAIGVGTYDRVMLSEATGQQLDKAALAGGQVEDAPAR